jgi:parallel beta-helix repeat protein
MTQETARTMLGLSPGAGVAESRQAYELLKGQLEESLRRAPTPSLQAKYRQRLNELEEAYSCLQNVAAGAQGTAGTENLPYLRKIATEQEPAPQPQEATLPKVSAGRVEPKPRASPALIAALVGLLTVGPVAGWWFGVEQPRQEAEKQRAAGVAEAQRRAEDGRRQKELADTKAKAEEAERQRQEAAANAQALEVQHRVEEQQRLARQKDEEEKRRLAALPQTRIVPDQYATIQAAIDAAKAGDTVLVKAGVYHEALKFKDGIELRGENPATTIVRFSTPATAVKGQDDYDVPLEVRNSKSGSVRFIGFEQDTNDERTDNNAWRANAIDVFDSSIAVEHCRAQSAAGGGIYISGANSTAVLTNNQCSGNKQGGIVFFAGPQGQAEGNLCEENQSCGINVCESGSSAVLTNNRCRSNKLFGISFGLRARGKAEGNFCEENGASGISIWIKAAADLTNNQCSGNKAAGIIFSDGASGRAENNLCDNNGWSGLVLSHSSPYLSANRLERNAQYGIFYGPASKPKFGSRNTFAGNISGDAMTNSKLY